MSLFAVPPSMRHGDPASSISICQLEVTASLKDSIVHRLHGPVAPGLDSELLETSTWGMAI